MLTGYHASFRTNLFNQALIKFCIILITEVEAARLMRLSAAEHVSFYSYNMLVVLTFGGPGGRVYDIWFWMKWSVLFVALASHWHHLLAIHVKSSGTKCLALLLLAQSILCPVLLHRDHFIRAFCRRIRYASCFRGPGLIFVGFLTCWLDSNSKFALWSGYNSTLIQILIATYW